MGEQKKGLRNSHGCGPLINGQTRPRVSTTMKAIVLSSQVVGLFRSKEPVKSFGTGRVSIDNFAGSAQRHKAQVTDAK